MKLLRPPLPRNLPQQVPHCELGIVPHVTHVLNRLFETVLLDEQADQLHALVVRRDLCPHVRLDVREAAAAGRAFVCGGSLDEKSLELVVLILAAVDDLEGDDLSTFVEEGLADWRHRARKDTTCEEGVVSTQYEESEGERREAAGAHLTDVSVVRPRSDPPRDLTVDEDGSDAGDVLRNDGRQSFLVFQHGEEERTGRWDPPATGWFVKMTSPS